VLITVRRTVVASTMHWRFGVASTMRSYANTFSGMLGYKKTLVHLLLHRSDQMKTILSISLFPCIYIYIYIYVCIYVYIYIYMFTRTCIHLFYYIYIYILVTCQNPFSVRKLGKGDDSLDFWEMDCNPQKPPPAIRQPTPPPS
jgi:hypothetical protein